jgi:hypothetical protein
MQSSALIEENKAPFAARPLLVQSVGRYFAEATLFQVARGGECTAAIERRSLVRQIFVSTIFLRRLVGLEAWCRKAGSQMTCMGLFLSSGCFWVLLTVLCSERERPFFVL